MTEEIANIEELLKNRLNGEVIGQEVTRLTEPGENYRSVVLKVDVKIKNEKNGEEEILPIVAKVLPKQKIDSLPMLMDIMIFKNEIAWYKDVMPTIKNFQKERGVEEVADFFPTMYGSRSSMESEKGAEAVIVLENLKAQGYENADRFVGFDLETSKAILKALATLHAVPITMKLENPQLFEEKIKSLLSKFVPKRDPKNENQGPPPQVLATIHTTIENLITEDPECAILWPRVKPFMKRAFADPDNVREPWGTVAHSDFWVNNIMVKPQNGGPPKVKIVDFQTTPYKSALSDFIFFLFGSVQTDVLKHNFDNLLKYYYEQFVENLVQLKVDKTELFPYEDFLTEIGAVLKEGELSHSLSFMFIIFAPKGAVPSVTEEGFNMNALINVFTRETSQTHKERAWFTVQECCKRNWV